MISCAKSGMLLKSLGSSETVRKVKEGDPHVSAQLLVNWLLFQKWALFLVDITLMSVFIRG